ncbi:MAG: hypothetical protein KUF77_18620 [Candidatus Thiodiazotropha sp. (ex Lucina aurantia)]|nr:hypothetical protein [Candidatus Thiodiazotropha sp. (ex Lucina pensylvanica)]MBT3025239.1 hypothetical protein [Candidatus Thiodiazotropha taylori]MBV2098382.1 hypothetical protein [Candidatus Thiodiazotropha sp. (ex Codakia orbicularis)]MBV2105048.1 hypothetical protein [Candidatus Thiodiazotropha sp. (ex Lucina aurantia)]MBV2118894.1 hypothetical protein [Candidatus Thiodiazotropha sp. (ex Lucina aurantia)]
MIGAFENLTASEKEEVIREANRKLASEGLMFVRWNFSQLMRFADTLDSIQRDYSNTRTEADLDRLYRQFNRLELDVLFEMIDLLQAESRTKQEDKVARSRLQRTVTAENNRFARFIRITLDRRYPSEERAIEKKRADRAKAREAVQHAG